MVSTNDSTFDNEKEEPREFKEKVSTKSDDEIKRFSQILEKLARSEHSKLLAAVAANPHTSVKILEILKEETNPQILEGIASNPKIPHDILDFF